MNNNCPATTNIISNSKIKDNWYYEIEQIDAAKSNVSRSGKYSEIPLKLC